jgi:anti-sigma regulatory factor (Ser/Thr protein kinase)
VTTAPATQATRYQRTYPGRAEQVSLVRHDIARYLAECPAADDAILITSEFAANAAIHSASRDEFFTVRCQLSPSQVQVEVEDLGGPWNPRPRDTTRPHGLDVIQALTGSGNWGITGDSTGRVAWARLTW